MAGYVYKFEDINSNILYVGRTKDIDRRMGEHFGGRGHIKGNCYRDTAMVYYADVGTEGNSIVIEDFLINKYHPPYNIQGKSREYCTLDCPMDLKWKIYKVFKVSNRQRKYNSKSNTVVSDMFCVLKDVLYTVVMVGSTVLYIWLLTK